MQFPDIPVSTSWLTVAWAMAAAASFTLAFVHLGTWVLGRRIRAHLWFALVAIGAGGNTLMELMMLRAETIGQYTLLMRAAHVPLVLMLVSMVWFIRSYFQSGRRWLAVTITAFWVCLLIANMLLPTGSVFAEIVSIETEGKFFGESFTSVRGVPYGWTLAASLFGAVSLLGYVVGASVVVWRRGERRRAMVIGGSMFLFVVAGNIQAVLVDNGDLQMPYMVGFCFLAIVLAMGFELSVDVAHASRLARELRESEHRMNLAARSANLGLWVWELESDEIWTTDKGRELFGFAPTEHLSLQRFLDALHVDDRDQVKGEIASSLLNGGDYESKHRVTLPDGESRWIAAFGKVEFDADRRPLRMRGVSMDVSHQRRMELEVLRQRGELAHLSRVAMLGELSGSLAHELNQPLAAILSNAQAGLLFLAHRGIDLPELNEILEDVVEADQRAGEVIRRLRILLKKGEVQMQPIDLNELAKEVLRLVRSDLINHNVAVQIDFAADLPPVLGDGVHLQQVILNLVMNACDAMAGDPADRRQLFVRTRLEQEGVVRVSIEDRGRGLPDGTCDEIFAPFYTTKPHGMGLGLSVCRTIIEAHGGSLSAHDNAERGATFHFVLPSSISPPR